MSAGQPLCTWSPVLGQSLLRGERREKLANICRMGMWWHQYSSVTRWSTWTRSLGFTGWPRWLFTSTVFVPAKLSPSSWMWNWPVGVMPSNRSPGFLLDSHSLHRVGVKTSTVLECVCVCVFSFRVATHQRRKSDVRDCVVALSVQEWPESTNNRGEASRCFYPESTGPFFGRNDELCMCVCVCFGSLSYNKKSILIIFVLG